MKSFLATRQVIYEESVIIEADDEDKAREILLTKFQDLNWGNKQFLDTDYYEIVEEVTDEL
jgi:hypothetical protein